MLTGPPLEQGLAKESPFMRLSLFQLKNAVLDLKARLGSAPSLSHAQRIRETPSDEPHDDSAAEA